MIDTNNFFLGVMLFFVLGIVVVLFLHFRQQENLSAEQAAASSSAKAAEQREKQAFIKKVAPEAVQLHKTYSVLPSVTIAQAILESNWGKSTLSAKYNNLFGVKGSDPANTQEMTTQEYVNGEWQTVTARFRVYASYEASILDHAQLFVRGTTWNPQQYQHFLAAKDYQAAAQALETDGYATDPAYAKKIIALVEAYSLDQYDK
ncbi:glycoside hydrolase family 73 protein [Lapidilactobacillus luobeiensis]|uniref:glycoside hydrolase family 73 protein n=1 Tax=Lapidilactobacillus luobeiensis TaxID=2950371 RepID=UPI0021C29367|nr:glycoside hydrolase family 73 protein [Lapidilactobacillus luobeiensis]